MKKDIIFSFSWKLTNYKIIELQFSYWPNWTDYFNFRCSWSKKEDHAGFTFIEGIFGVEVLLSILDSRLWNYDKDCWGAERPLIEDRKGE